MKYLVSGYCMVPMKAEIIVEAVSPKVARIAAKTLWSGDKKKLLVTGTCEEHAAVNWKPTVDLVPGKIVVPNLSYEELRREKKVAQSALFLSLREEGRTWKSIGEQVGLSSERVRQIYFFGQRQAALKAKLAAIDILALKEPVDPAVFTRSINEFNLTVRSQNCLACDGIYDVNRLARRVSEGGWDSLLNVPGLGNRCLNEIRLVFGMLVDACIEQMAPPISSSRRVDT